MMQRARSDDSSAGDGDSLALFVGVDGGGSTCRVSVLTRLHNGEALEMASAVGGGCNHNLCGIETASRTVTRCIRQAIDDCGMSGRDIRGVCLTMSGCDKPKDQRLWQTELSQRLSDIWPRFNAVVEVYNDSIGVLLSRCPIERYGLVIICGTGFICAGFDGDLSRPVRVGGWGPLMNDPCGAMAIGHAILREVALDLDRLSDAVCARFRRCIPSSSLDEYVAASSTVPGLSAKLPVIRDVGSIADPTGTSPLSAAEEKMSDPSLLDCASSDSSCAMKCSGVMTGVKDGSPSSPSSSSVLPCSLLTLGVLDRCSLSLSHRNELIEWVYEDTEQSWTRIASLAVVALEHYDKCPLSKSVIDQSIKELCKRVILTLDRMDEEFGSSQYSDITVDGSSSDIGTKSIPRELQVICQGSLFLKSDLYLNLFQTQLKWELGSRTVQSRLRVRKAQIGGAQYGAALYISEKVQNISMFPNLSSLGPL